ncbi:MAG: pantetheine-phosphate adenylyltransferase [Crocinitomicaceae bacterium]|jgi:pantetheine-phosphate adenylyltransferase|nr:pantetheine-phosphate adenylyltransferase [Crocinitomicaceae bacterium]MDP4722809.1 pantetheine-phosphate adenylyltransferase [Crocinitomicaceae bacterium]MDP4740233.1 pantetheine-phosphate adenylyltransferase [Crocinitomicaceae bacterium]MDP4798895.1 pantetheine-phosphate adenylyltransferase [Crocinitomicaceae bacterium]MDP4805585.1 pantetheine-phosphate adenylyltransferase [Crocinitomicaceae bacterium]
MKRCLFPGSFDPFTKGHEAIVLQALSLFDEVVVGVGINSKKQGLFSTEKKIAHIQSLFLDQPQVTVASFQKLTVEFCKDIQATHIVRGLRDAKDFEYERSIGHMNHAISGIDTVFFLTSQAHSAINSSIIREMYQNGADITPFVTNPELLV